MPPANSEMNRILSEELDSWPSQSSGIAVVDSGGVVGAAGDDGQFAWASVTKLLTALTVLHAAGDGVISLDDAVGPPGATVRHLLAHASGVSRDTDRVMALPGQRRIYSNRGMELLAQHLEHRAGRPFTEELSRRVLVPLRMTSTHLDGSPAYGAHGTLADLVTLARELLNPQWFPRGLLAAATQPTFGGISGVLPGFGRQEPNDWGLGFELRGSKAPHWMSPKNSPNAFGHFGQSGAFLWADPGAGLGCVAAGSAPFGPWAVKAWPRLATRVLEAVQEAGDRA